MATTLRPSVCSSDATATAFDRSDERPRLGLGGVLGPALFQFFSAIRWGAA